MASDDKNRPAESKALARTPKKQLAEKPLVEKIKTPVAGSLLATFAKPGKSTELSVNHEIRITQDMTPEATTALVQSSHNRYAVPAQEKTRRAILQAIQTTIKIGGACLCAVLIYLKPEAGVSISAVMGIVQGGIAYSKYLNSKKRNDKSGKDKPGAQED
jgi:hypothetical protein